MSVLKWHEIRNSQIQTWNFEQCMVDHFQFKICHFLSDVIHSVSKIEVCVLNDSGQFHAILKRSFKSLTSSLTKR